MELVIVMIPVNVWVIWGWLTRGGRSRLPRRNDVAKAWIRN